MNQQEILLQKQSEFLNFLKSRYNVFHCSNVFFRDLHYGVMAFLQMNRMPLGYLPSERLTHEIVAALEKAGILVRIDDRSWMLNYPQFKKPAVKPVAPAKPPVATAKPVPSKAASSPGAVSTSPTAVSVNAQVDAAKEVAQVGTTPAA